MTDRRADTAPAIADLFREVMRDFASTVSLVTACDAAGNPQGIAATTVNSLSMDPPSMLVAVNRDARAFAALTEGAGFCVNVLGIGDAAMVALFAGGVPQAQRFASPAWRRGPDGLPWLETSMAAVFLRTEAHLDYGTHRILCGRISGIRAAPKAGADPLVWRAGKPCRAVPIGRA